MLSVRLTRWSNAWKISSLRWTFRLSAAWLNGPGEALVSTLGVTGGNKKSGLYEDGVRKDRLDNNDMIDQLEARIRAKASQLDEARRIDVQQVEK